MKRPENMPFPQYRTALKRLNGRIEARIAGSLIYSSTRPYVAAEYDLRVKPLALAVRAAL